jgi:hypothetical protein
MVRLDVLRQPPDTFAIALAHDNRAHEDLNGTDALEGHFALTSRLVETKFVTLLGDEFSLYLRKIRTLRLRTRVSSLTALGSALKISLIQQ